MLSRLAVGNEGSRFPLSMKFGADLEEATFLMREAKRLLASGRRVGEVAEHLAFANAFHFSRRFKSFYRVAPSELRQRRGSN